MQKIYVKKKKFKWEKLELRKTHPKPENLPKAVKKEWKCRIKENGDWLLSVKYKGRGYDNKQITETIMMDAPKELETEAELEEHTQKQVEQFEENLQEDETMRIKEEMIIKLDEYEEE